MRPDDLRAGLDDAAREPVGLLRERRSRTVREGASDAEAMSEASLVRTLSTAKLSISMIGPLAIGKTEC